AGRPGLRSSVPRRFHGGVGARVQPAVELRQGVPLLRASSATERATYDGRRDGETGGHGDLRAERLVQIAFVVDIRTWAQRVGANDAQGLFVSYEEAVADRAHEGRALQIRVPVRVDRRHARLFGLRVDADPSGDEPMGRKPGQGQQRGPVVVDGEEVVGDPTLRRPGR